MAILDRARLEIIFGNSIDLDGLLLTQHPDTLTDISNKLSNTEYREYLTFLLTNQQLIIEEALSQIMV